MKTLISTIILYVVTITLTETCHAEKLPVQVKKNKAYQNALAIGRATKECRIATDKFERAKKTTRQTTKQIKHVSDLERNAKRACKYALTLQAKNKHSNSLSQSQIDNSCGTSAPRQPLVKARMASATYGGICKTLGEQKVTVITARYQDKVVPVEFPWLVSTVYFGEHPDSLNNIIKEYSYGKAWITGHMVPQIFVLPKPSKDCDLEADRSYVYQQAKAAGVIREGHRVSIIFASTIDSCNGMLGMSSFCSETNSFRDGTPFSGSVSGTLVFDNVLSQAPVIAHEMLHDFGVSHAFKIRHSDGAEPIESSLLYGGNSYAFDETGDIHSIMGFAPGTGSHISAPQKAALGWLVKGVDYLEVSRDGSYLLDPYETGSKVRAIKVKRPDGHNGDIWFEARTPVPWRAVQHPFDSSNAYRGVLGYFTPSRSSGNEAYALYFDPPRSIFGYALEAGQSYLDSHSGLNLSVVADSRAGSGLRVDVNYRLLPTINISLPQEGPFVQKNARTPLRIIGDESLLGARLNLARAAFAYSLNNTTEHDPNLSGQTFLKADIVTEPGVQRQFVAKIEKPGHRTESFNVTVSEQPLPMPFVGLPNIPPVPRGSTVSASVTFDYNYELVPQALDSYLSISNVSGRNTAEGYTLSFNISASRNAPLGGSAIRFALNEIEPWLQPTDLPVSIVDQALSAVSSIRIRTVRSNSWVAWREVQFTNRRGEVFHPTVITSSKSSSPYHTPNYAADNNRDTLWMADDDQAWITFGFGELKEITKLNLLPVNWVGQNLNAEFVRHIIEGSRDGVNFTPLFQFNGQLTSDVWVGVELDSDPAPAVPPVKFVKVETTNGNSWVSWREIEVYSADGSKRYPTSIVAGPNSNYYNQPLNTVDGNVYTAWVAESHSASITFDLGDAGTLKRVRLNPAIWASPGLDPAAVRHKIYGSADGNNFTLLKEIVGQLSDGIWTDVELN